MDENDYAKISLNNQSKQLEIAKKQYNIIVAHIFVDTILKTAMVGILGVLVLTLF